MFQTLKRELRTTSQRIGRNPQHAVAAVLVMTQAFFVAAIASVAIISVNSLIEHFENKPQVTAFLTDDATQTQVDEVTEILLDSGKVADVDYRSKEEALVVFREQTKDEPVIIEGVTADTLPASLGVSATDIAYLNDIAEILGKEKIVEDIIYQKDVVDKLTKFTTLIRNVGIVSSTLLLATSLLVMLIILGVSIASFKDEIEIMRLVGASNSYIRNPFIFEGVLYGLVSSIIAVGATYLSYLYLYPLIRPVFAEIPIFKVPDVTFLIILAAEALVGTILGIMAAVSSTWKHLKI